MMKDEKLLFELSVEGRRACDLPACDVPGQPIETMLPVQMLRKEPIGLPQVSEVDVVRHFTRLSSMNYGVDAGFYPLGSCTMKYNPKVNERAAALPGFAQAHPLADERAVQGCLRVLCETGEMLGEICGMDAFSLQPAAGAHGEMTGLMIIRAYFETRGETRRTRVLIPDAAHGTNPASAAMAGLTAVEIPTDARGGVDLAALNSSFEREGDTVAALMLTNPNTLGLFDENIVEIARIAHAHGALLYYDGANLNATLGVVRPGDMGFDVVHINLHKTFSTPHGGGGPGAGPVGVKAFLAGFLPGPLVVREKEGLSEGFRLERADERPDSIGRVRGWQGNFLVIVRAYAYIRALGARGLADVTRAAVLNANYVMRKLAPYYDLPYDRTCMHECVLSGARQKAESGVATLDIAKRLIDYGVHPPTIYFPLLVKEAMMIEPTETESRETLDAFVEAMIAIADEAREHPELLHEAPHDTPVGRLDETRAARTPVVVWNG